MSPLLPKSKESNSDKEIQDINIEIGQINPFAHYTHVARMQPPEPAAHTHSQQDSVKHSIRSKGSHGIIADNHSSHSFKKAESEKRDLLSPLLSKRSNQLEPISEEHVSENRHITEVPLKRKVRRISILSEKIAYDNLNRQLNMIEEPQLQPIQLPTRV